LSSALNLATAKLNEIILSRETPHAGNHRRTL
jgi:hypothetical protein